jgi:hypothetical protein
MDGVPSNCNGGTGMVFREGKASAGEVTRYAAQML